MTLSAPSAFAALTRPSMPPRSLALVAVAAFESAEEPEPAVPLDEQPVRAMPTAAVKARPATSRRTDFFGSVCTVMHPSDRRRWSVVPDEGKPLADRGHG